MSLALFLAVFLGVCLFVSISFSGISLLVCQAVSLAVVSESVSSSPAMSLMVSVPVFLALSLRVCVLASGAFSSISGGPFGCVSVFLWPCLCLLIG